jgi:excinuclease ABC subunit C
MLCLPLIKDQERLENILKEIPTSPGVYLFKDDSDRILYIGKSKKLRSRVRSYFRPSQDHSLRIATMVKKIVTIEFIITDTEAESLALEANLIKQYQPYFNVLLKDDKKYPYILITWSEEYPRLFITRNRRMAKPKDKYYGPYVDSHLLSQTLHLIKNIFPLRQRKQPLFKDRPCLNYDIGKCPGVCQRLISPADYQGIMQKIGMIFQGRITELTNLLREQMQNYAENLEFEQAGKIRDQIMGIERLFADQKVSFADDTISRDAIALAADNQHTVINLFQIRAGKLIGKLGFFTETKFTHNDILQTVLMEHYDHLDPLEIPTEIILQYELPETAIFTDILTHKKGKKVNIIVPQRQTKAELIAMVEKNAHHELLRIQKQSDRNQNALTDLAQILNLPTLPKRIEGYDISHIQGTNAVGSQVVFIDGLPAKQHYRHYKIKNPEIHIGHSDDFASLAEVITRRFKEYDRQNLPDLIMIDGGKGQLSSVVKVLTEMGLMDKIKIISLAKQREEIFLPGSSQPLNTNSEQPGVQLLRRLRDEAHRFAITFHRQQRTKEMKRLRKAHATRTHLDEIPQLGAKRQQILLAHFHSIDYIKQATVKQLTEVPGIGENLAQIIYNHFH